MATLIHQYHAENSLEDNQPHGTCASWARTFTTSNPAPRAGTYSLRVENRGNTDNTTDYCSSAWNTAKHRNELQMRNANGAILFTHGTEYWIGYSTYFATDWANPNIIVFQIIWGGTGPHIHGQVLNGNWTIVYHGPSGNTNTSAGPIKKGGWTDIVIRFKIAPGGSGILQVWFDGTQVVNKTNVAIGRTDEVPYFKFGSYWGTEDRGSALYVNYFDAVRVAQGTDGFDLVNPAAYDGDGGTVATPSIIPASGTHNAPLSVSMACDTPDHEIRFTLNGTNPTSSSTLYDGEFTLNEGTYVVNARAFASGLTDSDVASRDYVVASQSGSVSGLVFAQDTLTGASGALSSHSPESGGVWQNATNYSLTGSGTVKPSGTAQELVYLDGAPPAADQVVRVTGRVGTATDTIRRIEAWARCLIDGTGNVGYFSRLMGGNLNLRKRAGGSASSLKTAPVSGYSDTQAYTVEIHVTTAGGSTNLVAQVLEDGTVVAAVSDTDSSATQITAANHIGMLQQYPGADGYIDLIEGELPAPLGIVADPVFNPATGGTYLAPLAVEITSPTSGAGIYYTTNGEDPTTADTLYTGPIELAVGEHTLKARAFKDWYTTSNVISISFTVSGSTYTVLENFSEATNTALSSHTPDIGGVWEAQASNYTVQGGAGTVKPPTGTAEYLALNAATIGTAQQIRLTFGTGSVQTNRRGETWHYGDLPSGNKHGYHVRAWPDQSSFRITRLNNGAAQLLTSTSFTFSDAVEYTIESEIELVGGDPVITARLLEGETEVATVSDTDDDQVNKIIDAGRVGFLLLGDDAYAASFTVIDTTVALGTVADPVFTPSAGSYNNSVTVEIHSPTAQATVRYTDDGSDPTVSSTAYTVPIELTETKTLKARAFRTDYEDSQIVSATYTIEILQTVATPVIDPNGGTFTGAGQEITLTCPTADAEIYSRLDGGGIIGDIENGDIPYSAPFILDRSATLTVQAFKAGMAASSVVSAGFVIKPTAPVIDSFTVGTRWISIAFTPSTFPAGATPGVHRLTINGVAQEGLDYSGNTVKFDVPHANKAYAVTVHGVDALGNSSNASNAINAVTAKTATMVQAEAITDYD